MSAPMLIKKHHQKLSWSFMQVLLYSQGRMLKLAIEKKLCKICEDVSDVSSLKTKIYQLLKQIAHQDNQNEYTKNWNHIG